MTPRLPEPVLVPIAELAKLAGVPAHAAAPTAVLARLEPDHRGGRGRGDVARYDVAKARALAVVWRLDRLGCPPALLPKAAALVVASEPDALAGPPGHPGTPLLVIAYDAAEKSARPRLMSARALAVEVARRGAVFAVDLQPGVR